jgi:hypothetical protein
LAGYPLAWVTLRSTSLRGCVPLPLLPSSITARLAWACEERGWGAGVGADRKEHVAAGVGWEGPWLETASVSPRPPTQDEVESRHASSRRDGEGRTFSSR